jgi:hypothetical protein
MTRQININKEIRKRKFGWIGYTLRQDHSEPCKAALQWNPQGTYKRKWQAKKFMVTNYTERMWEAQLE